MARVALTREDIAAFRDRAVAAATHLFATRGYDAVTMRSLAAELGCSPMTPYRYFANKQAVLAAVRAEAFRRFADSQQRAAAGGGDPADRLLRLKRAYIEFALAEPDAYRIMFELSQPSEPGDAAVERESARAFSFLYEATRDAVRAGLLAGDPLSLAHVLWSGTHGLVSLHLAGKLTLGRSIDELAAIALELPRHQG